MKFGDFYSMFFYVVIYGYLVDGVCWDIYVFFVLVFFFFFLCGSCMYLLGFWDFWDAQFFFGGFDGLRPINELQYNDISSPKIGDDICLITVCGPCSLKCNYFCLDVKPPLGRFFWVTGWSRWFGFGFRSGWQLDAWFAYNLHIF